MGKLGVYHLLVWFFLAVYFLLRCWGAWSLLGLPYGGVTACALSRGLVRNWFPQLQRAEVNYWCDNLDNEDKE